MYYRLILCMMFFILPAVLSFSCRSNLNADSDGKKQNPAAIDKEAAVMKIKELRSGKWTPELMPEEQETLFRIAEDTLEWCVKKGASGKFDYSAYEITEKLKIPSATFVTLKMGGMLRGCIGSLYPDASLYKSVHDNAVNAAMKDFRFRPVTAPELDKIEVHISILSPITDIASIEDFKIGEHGIILSKGMNRAVYLPEVAVEQKWTVEDTLSSLSQKAGLRPDAWKAGASFKVFSSVVLEKK